ncbi:hypothetical protein [Cylindrospermum sp. FACHB-282]|uniref:hypothetical protein n=1 Tax=Cylindrospermum sp. FACHB-282 TaxID=2692794 RepID=UPI001F5594D4|nr:hypothetical protein [Cylindrospermum sp. FACHB-282]
MLTTAPNTSADLAATLLAHYSFDLNGYSPSELIDKWRVEHPIDWLHLAVIEALYLGRYKAVSVQQLLNFWQRRGQVIYHFNMEFERLICSKFPETLTATAAPVLSPGQKHTTIEQLTNSHLSPAKVENSYRQSKTTPQQLASSKEVGKGGSRDGGNVLTSPSFKVAPEPAPRQLAAAVSQKVVVQERLPLKTPSPMPTQLLEQLPTKANNPPIGQFTPQMSDRLPQKLPEQLPTKANNPPIGQFTPQMSERLPQKLLEALPAKPNNSPIGQFTPQMSERLPQKLLGALPAKPNNSPIGQFTPQMSVEPLPTTPNNPPIGQFTPQKSDRTESFTSKLKAMSIESAE